MAAATGAEPVPGSPSRTRLDPAELEALLHLRRLPRVGDVRLRTLLRRHGSARAALASASTQELGEPAARLRGARRICDYTARAVEALDGMGAEAVRECDPGYPGVFAHLTDPPYLVYLCGRRELLDRPAVAVVGSRRHTEYGAETARWIGRDLAAAGVVVVSGLAYGIDVHAHLGALERGSTLAVLGTGIDVAYPAPHARLQDRIAAEGLLLTEFDPGQPALRHHFPARNRLIAALSRGLVVVEAGGKSGSSITTNHALDLGREVFAVPGPIGRPFSKGPNAMLRDGASMVLDPADILDILHLPRRGPSGGQEPDPGPAHPPGVHGQGLRLWQLLESGACHVDELASASGLPAEQALVDLLGLELRGVVRQLAGKRFERVPIGEMGTRGSTAATTFGHSGRRRAR
jgi:DNA processing protein